MTFLGGQGEGGQNFPDLGGSEFSRTKFSRFVGRGGGEFLGLSFPHLEVLRSEFLKHPCMDCIARQKHKSTLEGSCNGIIDYDVEGLCIKLSRQHKLPLGAMKGWYVHFLFEKNVLKNNVAFAG